MIKELIEELSKNKIELSQALTRTKVIATKINSGALNDWLAKEVKGYEVEDLLLPEYRKIRCDFFLTFQDNGVSDKVLPLPVSASYHKELYDITQFHKVLEPVKLIENQLEQFNSTHAQIVFESERAKLLFQALTTLIPEFNKFKKFYTGCYQEVAKAPYQNILEQTKQKLLDTLLELDKEFPDLKSDSKLTNENNEKVTNIVTNNIYGNNNPLNIASGHTVEQKDISISYSNTDYSELEKCGVQKEEIEELKNIVQVNGKDKNTLKEKVLNWFISVSASVTAKELGQHVPTIFHFLQTHFLL